VPVKNNVGDDKTGFAFTIEGTSLPSGIRTSRVVFDPFRVFMSADDVLQQAKPSTEDAEDTKSALDEACEFLQAELRDGEKLAKDVQTAARVVGIKPDTLKRARKALGVRKRKADGQKGQWWMALPSKGQQVAEGYEAAEGADQNVRGEFQPLLEGVQ
jgi:hypothetical protein